MPSSSTRLARCIGLVCMALAAQRTMAQDTAHAGRFRREWDSSSAGLRMLHGECGELKEPTGWHSRAIDDGSWNKATAYAGSWLAWTLGLPWMASTADDVSDGNDDLLCRLAFDLPAGARNCRADLQLVVDDNAAAWINGVPFLNDPPAIGVDERQPRTLALPDVLRPCGNLLALRVHSMRPTRIGVKFRLNVVGDAPSGARCGDAARDGKPGPRPTQVILTTPLAALSPAPLPVASPRFLPTDRPTSVPTPLPTSVPIPSPTSVPTPLPTSVPTPLPTSVPTPSPTSKPAPLPARLPSDLPTPHPQVQQTPGPLAAVTLRAAERSAPCGKAPLKGPARRWIPAQAGATRVLTSASKLRLGEGPSQAGPELGLPFSLSAPARVWAEADAMAGLPVGDSDAAPEIFLDDAYLGPLLPEHGGDWRSPHALLLAAGPHRLLVRLAPGSGAPPTALSLGSLRVLSDGLGHWKALHGAGPCLP